MRVKKQPVTIDDFIKRLELIDSNILVEAANQPKLYMDASMAFVRKMRKRAEAQAAVDNLRATTSLKLRARKEPNGRKTLTEEAIKQHAELASQRTGKRAVLDRAFEWEKLYSLLLQALQMRRDAIRIIAEAENRSGMREDSEVTKIEQRRMMSKKARAVISQRNEIEHDEED